MNKITVIRTMRTETVSMGVLTAVNDTDTLQLFTLELPWKGNQRNISCVPTGEYNWEALNRPNGNYAIHIEKVPNRSSVLIHSGNSVKDIRGCILVGLAADHDREWISQSKDALAKLKGMFPLGARGTIVIKEEGLF